MVAISFTVRPSGLATPWSVILRTISGRIISQAADTEAQQLENLRITSLLKEALDVPYLFLSGGSHYALHRMIGPMLGCVMYLCVTEYDELATKSQPLLADVRAVRQHFPYLSK